MLLKCKSLQIWKRSSSGKEAWYRNHLALSLQCTLTLLIWKRVGPGPEAWARNHCAVSLDHSLTLRDVLMSLKSCWSNRASSLKWRRVLPGTKLQVQCCSWESLSVCCMLPLCVVRGVQPRSEPVIWWVYGSCFQWEGAGDWTAGASVASLTMAV